MRKAIEVLTELKEVQKRMESKDVYLYQYHQLLEQVDQLKEEYQSLPDKRIKCTHNYYFNSIVEYDSGFKELIVWKEEKYEDGTYYKGKSVASQSLFDTAMLLKPLNQYQEGDLIKAVEANVELRI